MGKSVTAAIEIAAQATQSPLRAVDYLRVSTDQQKKGYGIAYTGARTAAFIADKRWAHVETFKDEGESGKLPWRQRKDAARIMTLACQRPRPFDVVVVYETRAIGRRNRIFWEWVWTLQDLGVFVAVVDEDIDNTTEDGEARMQERATEDFRELKKIRMRTQGGIQRKAELGEFPGGVARYGYRIENQGRKGEQALVLDDCDGGSACSRTDPCSVIHEAPVLRFAREIAVRVKGVWDTVALYLNAEGFMTRSGVPWTGANIRSRLMDEDFLNARYVFRSERRAILGPDGQPVWGKSVTIPLPPMFTPDEVTELRRAATKSHRKPAVSQRPYPLSSRLRSLCGKHYVGASASALSTVHYRCKGKSAAFPGASVCDCSQLDADGIERWAWSQLFGLLGDRGRLKKLASDWAGQDEEEAVDSTARLFELDRKIAEQCAAIDIARSLSAKEVVRRGLSGNAAESAVEKALASLQEELEYLERERAEAAAAQVEAVDVEVRSASLDELVCLAQGRLRNLSADEIAELYDLLDIKIRLLGPPPPMHRGLACPVATWFHERERLVPTMEEEAWSRVAEAFPDGGTRPRQKGGLAPRVVLEAFLEKARTGATWTELDARCGSTGLRGHWRRWLKSGRWEAALAALEGCEGEPIAEPHPLPSMEMTGKVRPELIVGAPWAGVRPSHPSASAPSAGACCS